MVYLKSLFFNFLTVFFTNYLFPGIETVQRSKLPHIGGDLLFAFILGMLNSLIYPSLKLFKQEPTAVRIALIAVILNFASYAIVKLIPIGIQINTVEGYISGSVIVALGGFLTNYLEARHHITKPEIPQ